MTYTASHNRGQTETLWLPFFESSPCLSTVSGSNTQELTDLIVCDLCENTESFLNVGFLLCG